MESRRALVRTRSLHADGYLLVEAVVGVVLLAAGALGVAAALGQAEQLAAGAVQRNREAAIRAEAGAALVFGATGDNGWQAVGDASIASTTATCWLRVSSVAGGLTWIEARCGVGAGELSAELREPGLLVQR